MIWYVQPFSPWLGLVVPLKCFQSIAFHRSERVDEVSAQVTRYVGGHELATALPVLGPICVVADSSESMSRDHYKQE